MAKNIADGGGILPYYQKNAVGNYGNSMAEEAQSMADFAIAVAKLMPKNAPGGLTDAERATWENYGKTIGRWAYSKCPWTSDYTKACSIMSDSWMVTNHEFDPNPNYTLSLLTGISEMSMIYTQLGLTVPSDLITADVVTSVNNLTSSLRNYISDDFHFKGQFNKVEMAPSKMVITTFRYEDMTYTLNGEGRNPINSSIPRDRIDSANQYIIPGTSKVMAYVTQGSRVWHYICTIGSRCIPEYQKANISDEWRSRNILPPTDPNAASEWSNNPLPDSVDTISQWYTFDKTILKTYIYKGNRLWHYQCNSTECWGTYTQLISWPQDNRVAAKWDLNPPPSENIDTFTQYLVPGTGNLKSVIIKGNRVWMYDCNTVAGGCKATWTKDLSELWAATNKTSWGGINPPADSIDSFFSYVSPENTVKSYLTKGDRMWAVVCSDWDFNTCQASYTKTLTEYFQVIPFQFKWPQFPQAGVEQIRGISEWGMDATYQNSAFAGMYLVNPLSVDWYQKLQTEQIARGRKDRGITPLPINFDLAGNKWNYDNYIGSKNSGLLTSLLDGESAPYDLNFKLNTHWWMNMLAAKNHAMAYLALTSNHGLLGQFADDPSYIPPTPQGGLKAQYFGAKNLTNPLVSRVDPQVFFDWGTGSPASGVGVDNFSVRWMGQVVPTTTETYTFYTTSDDGVRLAVNGKWVINNWTDHSPMKNLGVVTLSAGQKYDIVMEYYENSGGAVAKLTWSRPSNPTEAVIPTTQLIPVSVAIPVLPTNIPTPRSCKPAGNRCSKGDTFCCNGCNVIKGRCR